MTPLHWVAVREREVDLAVARRLVDAGACTTIRDDNGDTPADIARGAAKKLFESFPTVTKKALSDFGGEAHYAAGGGSPGMAAVLDYSPGGRTTELGGIGNAGSTLGDSLSGRASSVASSGGEPPMKKAFNCSLSRVDPQGSVGNSGNGSKGWGERSCEVRKSCGVGGAGSCTVM